MSRVVIVAMKPHAGREEALESLVRSHVPTLRELGLATDREPIIMRAQDGTVIEVFEWASAAAIEAAHQHPRVQAMWGEYAAVCDFRPVGEVPEAAQLFSEFSPLG